MSVYFKNEFVNNFNSFIFSVLFVFSIKILIFVILVSCGNWCSYVVAQ